MAEAPFESRLFRHLRVVEIAVGGAVPWLTRHLAHHGAEVIEIESTANLAAVRLYVPVAAREAGIQPDLSPFFPEWHTGKRHIGLNLKHAEGRGLLARLVTVSDVLAVSYAARVMENWGLGYAACRALRPDLIYYHTTGYGLSGPHRNYISWGPNLEPLSGICHLTGFPDGPPSGSPLAIPDWAAALHGLAAVSAALIHRARTGEGQFIELSQFESAVALIEPAIMRYFATGEEQPRLGNRHPAAAPHGVYRCRSAPETPAVEEWIAIACFEQAEWEALARVAGHAEWLDDPRFSDLPARKRHEDALDRLIGEWTRAWHPVELAERLQAAGVPASAVAHIAELAADPHLRARGFFETVDHLRKGRGRATGLAARLGAAPPDRLRAGAGLGEDNRYVFGEILGLSSAAIATLCEQGVIERQEPTAYARSLMAKARGAEA